jgi:hypothetical protein
MTVSPGSGGGNTVHNLLEPCPPGGEVFYATPSEHPPHWSPFPDIAPRVRTFSIFADPRLRLRGARHSRVVRKFNELMLRRAERALRQKAVRQMAEFIRESRIDVLLVCPQSRRDLAACAELMEKTGVPAVVWFMDDYYGDAEAVADVRRVWDGARRRFVISEAMQRRFVSVYGGECEVLNNSVDFTERPDETTLELEAATDSRLRVVYAGAMHSYYDDVLRMTLEELRGLGDVVSLDIYSHEALPPELSPEEGDSWRHFAPVTADRLGPLLREYDVLLLLSSFKPEHRALAETSLASKTADYLAAGRCILVYGPEYAENVGYARRHNFGEVVTSASAGALRAAFVALALDPERRREAGERAYRFGRARHDRATNSERLWGALSETRAGAASSRAGRARNEGLENHLRSGESA